MVSSALRPMRRADVAAGLLWATLRMDPGANALAAAERERNKAATLMLLLLLLSAAHASSKLGRAPLLSPTKSAALVARWLSGIPAQPCDNSSSQRAARTPQLLGARSGRARTAGEGPAKGGGE